MVSFTQFPKIDAHFHSNYYNPVFIALGQKYNLRYITINTDTPAFPPLDEQGKVAREYISQYPQMFAYVTSFAM